MVHCVHTESAKLTTPTHLAILLRPAKISSKNWLLRLGRVHLQLFPMNCAHLYPLHPRPGVIETLKYKFYWLQLQA